MSAASLLIAVVLGLVEGITEFLPVSSTGHLIVAGALLHFTGPRAATFEVVIQAGAIVAVFWHYRVDLTNLLRGFTRDRDQRNVAIAIVLGFLPAAVIGLLLHDWIKTALFGPAVVGRALIVGGLAILLFEWRKPTPTVHDVRGITPARALGIGLAQTLAMVPGTSRAAATIIGGYALGLDRRIAVEFSFLLALPTITAAAALDLWKARSLLTAADVPFYGVGLLVSFVAALVVIRAFLRYVERYRFTGFAWYRIAFGALVLVLVARGVI